MKIVSEKLGRINQVGYYTDGIPKYVVLLIRVFVEGSFRDEKARIPITLVFMDRRYSAGIRRTTDRYMKICPDLIDEGGRPVRLSEILLECGLESKDTIGVKVHDSVIELFLL
jgi:hypothetical protein